jgi:transcription antitermination factor NusG
MDGKMTNNTHQWYALHTKAKAEYKVAAALEQSGFEIFLPEITTQENSKTITVPFFPCYLFMAANLDEVRASTWRWIPGLRHIVTSGSQPVHLPADVIRLIKTRLQELSAQTPAEAQADHGFQPGDTVRITHGPLRDMVAIFEGPTRPSRRVHVLLQVLDYHRRIQLQATDLEKVAEVAAKPHKRPRRTRGRGRRIRH